MAFKKNTFDYTRAKQNLRFGPHPGLLSGSGSRSGRRKAHFWLLLIVPALAVGLFLAIAPGRMQACDPQPPQVALLPDAQEATQAVPAKQPESVPPVQAKEIQVRRGDTLMELLVREGLDRTEAHEVVGALKPVFNPRQLRRKHALTLTYESPDEDSFEFKSLNIKLDPVHEVRVGRSGDDAFTAQKIVNEFETRTFRAEFEITSSLYEDAKQNGIPFDMLLPIINVYAYDVDFQRDIQAGDRFEIMYTTKVDADGAAVCTGTTAYAALTTNGRTLQLYQYCDRDGTVDYYDENGRSLKKNLMVTPVDGSRISSGYGMRRHPILGYSRMHRGLDFAAPAGTPIKAAGDGVVEFTRYDSSFGRNIRLRHAGGYKTRYAHMSRFARNIRAGVRVRQGQIIGYVGSTGLSTGPHLHYEVSYQGRSMNPARIKSTPNRILKGRELERFMAAKAELDIQFAALKQPAVVAEIQQPEA